jgi:hypothetical protein
MCFDPSGHGAVMNTQMPGCSPQIHAVHIQLNGLCTKLGIIAMLLFLWRILATANHAAISLTPGSSLPGFILPFNTITLWTFLHAYILAHILSHSLIFHICMFTAYTWDNYCEIEFLTLSVKEFYNE